MHTHTYINWSFKTILFLFFGYLLLKFKLETENKFMTNFTPKSKTYLLTGYYHK